MSNRKPVSDSLKSVVDTFNDEFLMVQDRHVLNFFQRIRNSLETKFFHSKLNESLNGSNKWITKIYFTIRK